MLRTTDDAQSETGQGIRVWRLAVRFFLDKPLRLLLSPRNNRAEKFFLAQRSQRRTALGASSAYEAHGEFLIDCPPLVLLWRFTVFGDPNTAPVGNYRFNRRN